MTFQDKIGTQNGTEEAGTADNETPPKKTLIEKFQIVASNAKNDPNAPVYLGGLFKGYLAFDTGQNSHYRWLCVINCAVLYNLIFVVGRSVFWELENLFPVGWYVVDYVFDFVYLLDIFIRMHEGKLSRIFELIFVP